MIDVPLDAEGFPVDWTVPAEHGQEYAVVMVGSVPRHFDLCDTEDRKQALAWADAHEKDHPQLAADIREAAKRAKGKPAP